MPAAAPVAPPAEPVEVPVGGDTVDVDEVPPAVWTVDRLPASARVADRVLSTCRAAGCAPLTARRPARRMPLLQAGSTRRLSR